MNPTSRRAAPFALLLLSGLVQAKGEAPAPPGGQPPPALVLGALPEVRLARADWSAAKNRVSADPAWRAWAEARRKLVEEWFSQPRDPISEAAGFPNDFIDPQTGAALPRTPYAPEPAAGSPAPVHRAWVAIRRQAHIAKTLEAARLQRLLGLPGLAEVAARQLDAYAAQYGLWPLQQANGRSRMLGQSLDEAVSAFDLVEAVHLLGDQVSAQRRLAWETGLLRPMAENLKAYNSRALNNVDLWCSLATAAIALTLDDQALLRRAFDDPVGVRAVVRAGLGEDGLWREASFTYQGYVLQALARFADTVVALGRADAASELMPVARRLLMSPLDWRFDDGSLPSPSDARFRMPAIDLASHLALYRHTPTPIGLQAALRERNWNTLLDPPGASPAVQLPPVRSRVAADVRFAQLRRGPWQLFVHYGQSSASHAQEEALAYELLFGVESISRDAGTAPSYAMPVHRDYFARGVGNNAPLIDGAGQAQPAPGEMIEFQPEDGRMVARQRGHRPGLDVERRGVLVEDGVVESTAFQPAVTTAASRLGVVFHTECRVEDEPAGATPETRIPQGSSGFSYWKEARRWTPRQAWGAQLVCGGQRFALHIDSTARFEVWRARAPSTPLPAMRDVVYVEAQAGQASFTTAIRRLGAAGLR